MSQKKQNLARIRDNQRRSRARRKEHLQELEARLRQCELQGVEASSEIQMAARRVADENKKLRSLLAQHGIADDMVDTHLQSSASTDNMIARPCSTQSSSVQVLEQLLSTRKACCVEGNGAASNGMTAERTVQRGDSCFSASTTTSLWDPVHTSRSASVGRLSPGRVAPSAQQFMPPSASNSANRHNSLSRMQCTDTRAQNQQQHPQAHPQRYTMAPGSLPREQSRSSSVQAMHQQQQQQQYQMNAHLPNQVPSHPSSTTYAQPNNGNSNSNYNSCMTATDIISSMAGGDPSVISADLGCVPGVDCAVDNHLVFNVMDRHTVGV
ncbi:bzip transcription factor protein [Rutstroemia sp. NJR-2017a BBW]|nr:bzip transcription factor protein [Rutstroemia sp. NJR-2017a BBW]